MRNQIAFAQACALLATLLCQSVGCSSRELLTEPNLEYQGHVEDTTEAHILELGEQARKNLNLVVKPIRPTDYWRTVSIPGVVADRPGISDRGVTSPAVGVVSEIYAYPGDTVRPGQRLVTVRLFSEYLQATQTQLFKASQEVKLLQNQIDRVGNATLSGAVSGSRMLELQNDQQRQITLVQTARQELLNRGLTTEQIDSVANGTFVSSVDIIAPPARRDPVMLQGLVEEKLPEVQAVSHSAEFDVTYEVQSLEAELGQTVQAGELVINLSNHQSLYVVGHAFKREAALIEQATQSGTPVNVHFAEDSPESWPKMDQEHQIRHLSNTIDIETRTFDFFVPLQNQSRKYDKDGTTYLVWRFRPGQRTRIEVPVEKLTNVFVLPSEAVVRDGPVAYAYQQNGDLFNQIEVTVVHEDRLNVVIANDRSITPGTYFAQNASASLRRVLKAQSASGQQPGLHVHADGTVHTAH